MVTLFSPSGQHLKLSQGERCRHSWLAFLIIQCLIMFPLTILPPAAGASADRQGKPAGAVAFSPTGDTIVTGNEDGVLTLWDLQSGKPVTQFKGESAGIVMMASSSAAESVAVGTADGIIEFWDVDKGRYRQTLRGHEAAITALDFSENGELLASGSSDRTIKLWDVQSGRLLKSTREGRSAIQSLSFSPDGQTLASDGDEQNVRLWRVQTGDLLGSLKGHGAPVAGVAISADGEFLASSSAEGLLIWSMKRRQSPPIGVEGGAKMLAFSPTPQGSLLASVTDDEIWLWNVEQERRAGALKGHTGKIKALAFSPDGKQIVSLGSDNTVRLWSLHPNEVLLVINTLNSEVQMPAALAAAPGAADVKAEPAAPVTHMEPAKAPAPLSPESPVSRPSTVSSSETSSISAHPSQLQITQVVLGEFEKGARTQSRDRVEVSASVANPGPGTVSKARAKLHFGPEASSAAGSPEEFELGEMPPGAVKVLKFSCVLGSAIKSGMRIPISVVFTNEFDAFVKEEPLNLVMNAPGSQPLTVEPARPVRTAQPPPPQPVLNDEQRKALAKEYYEKGNIAFEALDFKEAVASYTQAIELEDSFAPLFYNLGMAHRALGQNKKAIKNFKRYLVLRPDAPNASEVLEMIEVLRE